MKYFRIPNLQKYQQYKDRSPPWIKFHADILDDYDFAELPDSSKAHVIHLWLLASRQHRGLLPWNETWLRKRINAKSRINLSLLQSLGFIEVVDEDLQTPRKHDANVMQTKRKQHGPPRQRRVEERKRRGETETRAPARGNGQAVAKSDIQDAFNLYNEMAKRAGLPIAQVLNATRQSKLKKRLQECGGTEGWQTACESVEQTDFLTGNNNQGWRASLDFMLQPSSFVKIMEGTYSRSANARQKLTREEQNEHAFEEAERQLRESGELE